MRNSRPILLLCLLVAVASPVAHATAYEFQNVTVDDAGFPKVSVDFEVLSDQGELISTLTQGDVSVREGTQVLSGEVKQIGWADGIAFVFAIDISLSMREGMPAVKQALGTFVDGLDSKDRAAIVTFHDDVKVETDFTSDHSALRTTIQNLSAVGKRTELFTGVDQGLELLKSPGLPRRKVLVVISDGKNEGGSYTLESCREKARATGVSIMGFGIREGAGTDWRNIERLSKETAGVFTSVRPGQAWSDKFGLMRRNLESRWRFTWTSKERGDGLDHRADIEVKLGEMTLKKPMTYRASLVVKKQPYWLYALIAAVVLGGAATLYILSSKKRKKAEEERLQQEEQERLRREAEMDDLKRQLSDTSEKIETMGQKVATAKPEESKKKKTVFISGAPKTVSYSAASIQITTGPLSGARLPLLDGTTTLGRADDNNVVLNEDRVSNHHARIVKRAGVYWLEDLGSTNGTYVDGSDRIREAVALVDGQTIRLGGGVTLVFKGEA
jgi:hypothetical protein